MRIRALPCLLISSIAAATIAQSVYGGVTFNSASTSKWTFAADLNNLAQVQNQSVNPPPASGSMPAPPTYQLNKTFTSGSASAVGKGSIGYVANSTTASFTLSGGCGAAQTDPSNIYTGATSLKCDFDGTFNPTSPSFGSPATGYVSISVGGTVGTSGYTRFIAQVQFLNGNTNAVLRPNVSFDQTFNIAGPFSKTFVSSATLSPTSIPVGTPIKVKGFFQFLASNLGTPSDITPIDIEFAAAPPTATWYVDGNGNWNDPANWTAPAGSDVDSDGSIPAVPNTADQRARFINIFSTPRTVNLTSPISLGTMQVDTAAGLNVAGSAANKINFNVTAGEAVMQVSNTAGGGDLMMNTPVTLSKPLKVIAELKETPLEVDGAGSRISFMEMIDGPGAFIKEGAGSATLQHSNTFAGGTQARGGYLSANVPGSLSNGSVLADDGQLNYNANGAAAPAVVVTAQHNGQIDLGVVANPSERFALNDLGAISGDATELGNLNATAAGNLMLAPGAMIAHEALDQGPAGNPQGVFGIPGAQFVFGLAASFTDVPPITIPVGSQSGTPWIGFGGDRRDRTFGLNSTDTDHIINIAGNASVVSLHNTMLIYAQVNSVTPGSSLTKRGGGTVVLANVNNGFNGPVTVESGALLITGNLNSATQTEVQPDASLGGTGVLGGNVHVQNAAHLFAGKLAEPTSSLPMGSFEILGNLALEPGAFLDIEINGPGQSDTIMVGGSLLLDGIMNITALEDFLPGNVYTLFESDGTITDNGLMLGFAPDDFLYTIQVTQPGSGNPGSVMLVTQVPEPASLSLLLVAAASMMRRRRH